MIMIKLKYKPKVIVFICCSLFVIGAFGQEVSDTTQYPRLTRFPLLTTDYYYYPESSYQTDAGEGLIEVKEIKSSLQMAFPLKEKKLYLFNSLQHTLFSYNTYLEDTGEKSDETFHSFQLTVGLIQVLPQRWQLIWTVLPTLASDFGEPLHKDDFILQLSALAKKRSSANVEYGFGVAYTSQFGKPLVVPLFNLTRKVGPWLTVMVLPSYAMHAYQFNEATQLGFKAAVYGNLFNVNYENTPPGYDLNRVSYSRITIGPEFQQKIIGDLFLTVGAGFAVRNKLEIQDNDLNKELVLDVKERLFLNIGLKVLK